MLIILYMYVTSLMHHLNFKTLSCYDLFLELIIPSPYYLLILLCEKNMLGNMITMKNSLRSCFKSNHDVL